MNESEKGSELDSLEGVGSAETTDASQDFDQRLAQSLGDFREELIKPVQPVPTIE